ncbi:MULTISPECIES: type I polyketide synthase [unclassified Okeania]|uniref:type I polyketide synthase n=1 Tax=unclassified Okeania TaxID=2634635 RepID=UPI0013BB2346|nr:MULTISPECIES: type I polyketide synthase [unclassified Okeania]NES79641.1 SDR family NAD(P)-dependent oxidoreductase [Okeania sp. SIO1H4]NET23297.1 SDR family NAD(P)-dependent oxidoreductase [Okeania sp. SIO1H5]NET96959.1 SDR family NAD(P)-dependent oxidoreductase [Okeania sp. SIO1H2]
MSEIRNKNFSSEQLLQVLKEMRIKLEAANKTKTEPIAIVGMSCRFPGGADNLSAYWQLLQDGTDAITKIPSQRWDADIYYDQNPEIGGKAYTKEGGFLEQVDQFDPDFFGICPREAVSLDPQQRMLLEVSWEALENSGQTWANLRQSKTGVFMGLCTDDYAQLNMQNQDNGDAYSTLGVCRSMGTGRIAHLLGLQGPNIQLDTACSSSLVALHLACQSLRLCESNLALAGGVNLLLSPRGTISRCRLKALSPDGRCKTFDASANGYGQGEGCGVVVLKRLSDAINDGDLVLAIIRGSAINHNGPSNGLTVPSRIAQKKVIEEALANAKLEPHQVSYVEAHGSGTSLGDPIEIEALDTVYGKERPVDKPLLVGSVKTNFGHLEAAAGISSLIKVVLALQHQEIPPHLHFNQPNPHIAWDELAIKIPVSLVPWSCEGKPRIAGISSFGMSGTNVHLILEEAPREFTIEKIHSHHSSFKRPSNLLTLSAKTEVALTELAIRYQHHLETHPELDLADICYTANTGRVHFNHRLAIIASEKQELADKLAQISVAEESLDVFSGKLSSNCQSPKKAFLFTGQGSQYLNMGRELYQTQPLFRQTVDQCSQLLQPYLEHPLLSVIYPDTQTTENIDLIDQTAYTQPALFAIEYALAKLWQSWGIEPDILMGHSVGEYVAATVAGVFSLEDGLKLIAHRGRLMQQLPAGGKMLSVIVSEQKINQIIAPYKDKIAIAAINGAESIVISGVAEVVGTIKERLEAEGIKTKQLQVSHAFHSPLMEPILAEFEGIASEVTYNQPKIPLISNLTGTIADENIATANYWVNHIRQSVKFAQSMKTLHQEGYSIFLEIGPKPTLLGMVRQCLPEDVGVWLPSLRPNQSDWQQMLQSLAELYVQGVDIDWLRFDQDYSRNKVMLPTYPFQRQRYWIEKSKNGNQSSLTENSNTTIVNLLSQGKIDTLAQELEKVGNLSQGEIDLLPKLLDLLSKQHQQQLETVSIKDWFYQVEWRKTAIFSQLQSPDYLPTPPEVEKQLTSTLKELVTGLDNDRSEQIQTCLEELSIDYIVQALQEMSWPYEPTDSFSIDSAASRLGIVKSQRQLFNRMLQILASVGIVQSTQQQWQVLQTLEKVDPSEKSQKLLSQYPDEEAALILLHRCASQLSGVLRGAVDPVQLVFPEGDLTTATRLYQESPAAKVMNTIVEKAIAKAIEKLPQHRGLRILEIGAGTGGTTSYILPHLPPTQTEYVFSDLGTLFTTKAKQKFQEYPFVQYQTLDIEVEPVNQGFEPHQYDVVIAANVLHATANIKQTLSHVKKLLMPGGMLLLLEGTTPQKWIDLIFGLLEGWWKFQDYELRPDYPLLSRSKWKQVLSETGFTQQVVALPDIEGMAECLSRQSVIVAEADETTVEVKSRTPKNWLILADTQGVAQQLANQMRSVGEQCTLVFVGEKYQQLASEEFTINPHNPEEFEELIANVAADSNSTLYGVVQCWTTEAFVGKEISFLELENLSQLGCGTTLSVVQALVKSSLSQPPRLWLVTSGTQPVPESNPAIPGLAQSAVWGMGKVINLEHPELSCMQIDLDPTETIEHQAWELFDEIWSDDRENQVAWRGNSRYVARLVRSSDQQTEVPLNFRENASYLITGGMGGLGLLVARWMVSRGANNLVLLGRRSPDNAILEKLTELEQAGAQVVVEKADVSEWDAMERVFENINQSTFPLAGVIHSAGVLSDGTLPNQSWSSFEKVMSPKVQGGWHLHQLTKNLQLDFFVLFSSMASILGAPGQGNHSAANSFLDGLAHYRRSMGLPGLSLNFGAVSQIGEAAERGADVRAQQQGLGAMTPEQVLESLELVMSGSDVEVGIAPIDWSVWQERIDKWPLLADWKEITSSIAQESKSDFLQHLEAATVSEKRDLLVSLVRTQVAKVLGMNNEKSIGLDEGFFDLGMDSLTSVELRNKLQTILECSIPFTLAFDYPTMGELIDYLAQQLLEKTDSSDTSITKPIESNKNKKQEDSFAKTKELSEEQLEELINQKLKSLIINK